MGQFLPSLCINDRTGTVLGGGGTEYLCSLVVRVKGKPVGQSKSEVFLDYSG